MKPLSDLISNLTLTAGREVEPEAAGRPAGAGRALAVPRQGAQPLPGPVLSASLQAAVTRAGLGPTRYPGIPGSDDPGFVLSAPQAEWHPEAEAALAQFRASGPPSFAQVREWLDPLVMTLPNAPTDAARLAAYIGVLVRSCGHFAFSVWDAASVPATVAFEWWPTPRGIFALLEAAEAEQRKLIAALERIAGADPAVRSGPARASTAPYNPGAPDWALKQDAHPSMPKSDTAEELAEAGLRSMAQAPVRTVAEQLAELGLEAVGTDLLEARRRHFEVKR
jgi:hypothetical protein